LLRVQRYLLSELLATFALVALIVTGVFLTGSFLQVLGRYPETSLLALLRTLPLFAGLALPVTLPVAFLMACLLAYGRFADDNEFLAFQMGGLSPRHAVAPAICAAAAVSIFAMALSSDINPALVNARNSILRVQVCEQLDHLRSSTGAGSIRIDDMEMSWAGRRGEWFCDVALTYTTTKSSDDGAPPQRTTNQAIAREAMLRITDETPTRLAVTLVDGVMSFEVTGGMTESRAARQVVFLDLDDDSHDGKSKDEMRSSELFYRMARLEPILGRDHNTKTWRAYIDISRVYWKRVALGLSPIAFALIGVPLGLFARRGSRGQALVLALALALPVYYPLLLWGETLARRQAVPPAWALNLPNILLATAGTLMIRRLVTR
jgi:lipopolysaccharide export system permease protein